MSNPSIPESQPNPDANESFDGLLSQYERSHSHKRESGNQIEGTVVAVSAESVFFDIGFKTEGILSLADLQKAGKTAKPGDKLQVTVKGRDPEGYYALSLFKVIQPMDWASLEKAFAEKAKAAGVVVRTSVATGRDQMSVVRSLLEDKSDVLNQVLVFLKEPKTEAK